MRTYPLFDPLAWLQAGVNALDAAAAAMPRLRTPLLRDQVRDLKLPPICARCSVDPCAKRRADFLKENPNEL